MKKIGIVIPAYCENDNIVSLCREILSVCPYAEIIIVDDSPNLKTIEAVNTFSNSKVSIIHRKIKGGRGSAVLLGIQQLLKGDYDFFLEIDADFSHPPKQIPLMINYSVENNTDLLIASRYLKNSRIINWPISRRVFSICSNFAARSLLKVPVKDYTNGYRLYSRKAAIELVETCGQLGGGFISLSEILVNLYYRQYKIEEIPTKFVNRIRGQSSLSYHEIWNALLGLYSIWLLKKDLSK